MSELKNKVEKGLLKLQEKRRLILSEVNQLADIQSQDVKQRTWLQNKAAELVELEKRITQHLNRLEGMERRRQVALNAARRKRDTKLKILLGAWVIHEVDNNRMTKTKIKQSLTTFITREKDNNLIDEWLKTNKK